MSRNPYASPSIRLNTPRSCLEGGTLFQTVTDAWTQSRVHIETTVNIEYEPAAQSGNSYSPALPSTTRLICVRPRSVLVDNGRQCRLDMLVVMLFVSFCSATALDLECFSERFRDPSLTRSDEIQRNWDCCSWELVRTHDKQERWKGDV